MRDLIEKLADNLRLGGFQVGVGGKLTVRHYATAAEVLLAYKDGCTADVVFPDSSLHPSRRGEFVDHVRRNACITPTDPESHKHVSDVAEAFELCVQGLECDLRNSDRHEWFCDALSKGF